MTFHLTATETSTAPKLLPGENIIFDNKIMLGFTEQFQGEFSQLADDLMVKKYFKAQNVFSDKSMLNILEAYNFKKNSLRPASIGKGEGKAREDSIRNDSILWIDEKDQSFSPIWGLNSLIQRSLREHLYLPIKRFETQISLYKKGHFYKRHVDKHKANSSRELTMVFYLNSWLAGHGGELAIYPDGESSLKVEPLNNSLVLFFSEIEHEVMKTNVERRSLTTWFCNDI